MTMTMTMKIENSQLPQTEQPQRKKSQARKPRATKFQGNQFMYDSVMNPQEPHQNFLAELRKNKQFGGAALEYVLVTTFAAITGIAALGFVGSVMKSKVENMAEKLGVEITDIEDFSFNPFGP